MSDFSDIKAASLRVRGGPVEADPAAARRTQRGGSTKPPVDSRRMSGDAGASFSPFDGANLRTRKSPLFSESGPMTPDGSRGIGRGAPVTKRRPNFDAVEAPKLGKANGPVFSGGAAGAVARREESRRVAKYYKRAP